MYVYGSLKEDMKLDDLTGKRFGMLSVTHRWSEVGELARWHCICDCGASTVAKANHLKEGTTKSCGCLRLKKSKDLVGKRFFRMVVMERAENLGSGVKTKARWKCLCDCGNYTILSTSSLTGGNTKSCGCLKREIAKRNARLLNRTHGMTGTRVHNIWCSMHQRCYDPKHKSFEYYGGRGITVCQEWHDFSIFLMDMGCPDAHLTLDRIKNDVGYHKENCRWATAIEQQNNRRDNVQITAFGRTQTIAIWAKEVGLAKATILTRIGGGMTPELALSTPPRKNGPRTYRFAGPESA